MKLTRCFAPILVLALGACAAEEAPEQPSQPAAEVSDAALRIEQAERLLDRGADAAEARAVLEAAIAAPDITAEEKSRAILALSRAHEALGDREKAIAVLEAELAAHDFNDGWPDEAYEKRLLKLLTGSETTQGVPLDREETAAPFAHVVASYFPPNAEGKVLAKFLMTGADEETSDELGTFNIGGALRQQQRERCPLCTDDVNVSVHVGRSDWLLIPRKAQALNDAMTVFYFDLGKNRIPARYEKHLPMKVADIERELEAGKSFVLAKERAGSPPSLLLAAPRSALLGDVEAKLATLDTLPTTPVYVDVSARLRPEEIRGVVRKHWRPELKRCYEDLLKRTPSAGGQIRVKLAISPEGHVENPSVESEDASLRDATFSTCVTDSAAKLPFPATGERTTVTYPFKVSPD
jgi:hypothetical protein